MPSSDLTTPAGRVRLATSQMDEAGGPVPLDRLAGLAACSPRQLQRDFDSVLAVTPRQYGAQVRSGAGRRALRRSPTVLHAVHEAGYGSVRAFYEETARRLGMPPKSYAAGAPHLPLLWGATPSAIGDVAAVASPAGLCAVRIGDRRSLATEIADEFARADLRRDDSAMADVMAALRMLAAGLDAPQLPVVAIGTAFQARVWAALREIPAGQTRTYTEVAAAVGAPGSARAVGRACATNPVALAVPCHRVVRADGNPAGYRWGLEVKRSLLALERGTGTAPPAAGQPVAGVSGQAQQGARSCSAARR